MATAAPQRFEASPIPPAELDSREEIRFLHPGYPPPNTLLSLPRVDGTPTGTFGVHHRTALLACQIIANNAFDVGRLTLDQAGLQPVNIGLDDVLTERVYYFIVGNGPDRYPVVPSFQDWEFPHDRIPDSWPEPQGPQGADGQRRCGITNFRFPLEEAHLVPKEEVAWYFRNDMGRYCRTFGFADINDPTNLLPLKTDVHDIFDARGFVIVPKVAKAEISQYVTHILRSRAAELWPTHHDILVQHLHKGSRPYLFARFAWAILLPVKAFLISGSRRIIRVQTTTDTDRVEKVEYKTEFLTGKQLKDKYGGGGSKAATPLYKRSRTDSAMDEDEDYVGSPSDEDLGELWDVMDDWKRGGKRRRLQQSSSETAPDTKPSLQPDVEADLKEALLRGMRGEQTASQEAEMALRLK